MVTPQSLARAVAIEFPFADVTPPLWVQLAPEERARVFAALGAVVVLGICMILLVWWGARATRRYMNRPVHSDRPPIPVDDWASRPLYPKSPDENEPDENEPEGESRD